MRNVVRLALVHALAVLCAPAIAAELYRVVDLGTLGGDKAFAYGINNLGQVVGSSIPSGNFRDRGFVYDNGMMANLGTLPGGSGGDSVAYAINNSGEIAGYSTGQTGGPRGVLWSNGAMIDLGTLGGGQSYAYSINDSGQVVGLSYGSNNIPRAFLYSNGVMSNLGTLPGMPSDSLAKSINNSGQIVGHSVNANAAAFLIDHGVVTSLGTLGGNRSYASSINDAGTVVGSSRAAGSSDLRAVVWQSGMIRDLGVLDGLRQSSALDINASGVIVGRSWYTTNERAFLYDDGQMVDLNDLMDSSGADWLLQKAISINDQGWIVGTGYHGAGNERGFLLIPVPEPGSLSLAMLGLLTLSIWHWTMTTARSQRT